MCRKAAKMSDSGRPKVTQAKYRKIDPRELEWETAKEGKLVPEVMVYTCSLLYMYMVYVYTGLYSYSLVGHYPCMYIVVLACHGVVPSQPLYPGRVFVY